jgi:hypothetical protein
MRYARSVLREADHKDYTRQECDNASTAVEQQLAAYKKLGWSNCRQAN